MRYRKEWSKNDYTDHIHSVRALEKHDNELCLQYAEENDLMYAVTNVTAKITSKLMNGPKSSNSSNSENFRNQYMIMQANSLKCLRTW